MPTTQGTFTVPNSFVEQYDLGQKKIRADLVDENFTDVANAITTNITNISTAQTTADNAATAATAAQGTADSALTAATTAATTTAKGVARLATTAEVQAGAASASPLPAVLDVNDARSLPKATNALFGLGRSATDAEATAGETVSGTGPAWVTPEQLGTGLAGKTDGTVVEKSQKSGAGPFTWTITDLVIGKPLFILLDLVSGASNYLINVVSGGKGGYSYNNTRAFIIGTTGMDGPDVFITIPTSSTVVLNITSGNASNKAYAFQ